MVLKDGHDQGGPSGMNGKVGVSVCLVLCSVTNVSLTSNEGLLRLTGCQWSWLSALLYGIDSTVDDIREIDHAVVDDDGAPAIFMHARPRIPASAKHILARGRVDDDAATVICGPLFDVIDGRGDVIDNDILNGNGLRKIGYEPRSLQV